ncbi:hypothetical protein ACOMHN_011527 [Nucella lapillus]
MASSTFHLLTFLFCVCVFQTHTTTTTTNNNNKNENNIVKLAILLPFSDSWLFSKHKVQPAVDLAVERVHNLTLLRNFRFSIGYGDSQCDAIGGPIHAFKFYMNGNVDTFLAPCCDYSLAPVARYSAVWKIPVISPGGYAHNFGTNKRLPDAEYATLTRVGATFDSLSLSIMSVVTHYGWGKLKVIYDVKGHGDVMPKFCYLAASALVHHSKMVPEVEGSFHILIPGVNDLRSTLVMEVGIQFSEQQQQSNNNRATTEQQQQSNNNRATTTEQQQSNNRATTTEQQQSNNNRATTEQQQSNNRATTEQQQQSNNNRATTTEQQQQSNNRVTTTEQQQSNNRATTTEQQQSNNNRATTEQQQSNNRATTEQQQQSNNNRATTTEQQQSNNRATTEQQQQGNNRATTTEQQQSNNRATTEQQQSNNNRATTTNERKKTTTTTDKQTNKQSS